MTYEMNITIFKKDEDCSIDDILLAHKSFKFDSVNEIIEYLHRSKISMEDNIY